MLSEQSHLQIHSSTFALEDNAQVLDQEELTITLQVESKDFLPICSLMVTSNHALSENIFEAILGVFERSKKVLFGIDYFVVQSSYPKSSIARHDQLISSYQQLAY